MRVLLDECLPRRLKHSIIGHEVVTVPEAGWAGRNNGELVRLSEGQFDVFLTIDQNLPAQQNLSHTNLAVVVLVGRSNRFDDLEPLTTQLLQVLESIRPGQVVRLGG